MKLLPAFWKLFHYAIWMAQEFSNKKFRGQRGVTKEFKQHKELEYGYLSS